MQTHGKGPKLVFVRAYERKGHRVSDHVRLAYCPPTSALRPCSSISAFNVSGNGSEHLPDDGKGEKHAGRRTGRVQCSGFAISLESFWPGTPYGSL